MKTTTKYIALAIFGIIFLCLYILAQGNQVTLECACVYQGKTYDFCYTNPQNRSLLGTKFHCSHGKVLEDLDFLNSQENLITIEESIKNVRDVVFVSAATNDHLMYTLESFKTIRKYYPTHKYVFYGLNLDGPNVLRLPKDLNFEFRRFNTTSYPQYVNNFPGYHFKNLLEFLPTTSIEVLKTEQQVGSGFIFVPRTKETLEILKWWVLCSLTEKCINPVGHKLRCNFDTDRFNIYAKFFRYDQSVLNLLLLNKYREHKKYYLRVMGEHVL